MFTDVDATFNENRSIKLIIMFTRRRFLLTMATVSAVAAAGAYIGRPYLAKLVRPELDATFPLGSLQENEMRTIVALGETLVFEELMPPEEFFREYVDEVAHGRPGFLKEYQSAAKLLDTTSIRLSAKGRPIQFADLARTGRDKVVRELLWRYDASDRIVRKFEKITVSRDALALREYVMSHLLEHYYRSTYGWAVVGYKYFPGRPPPDPRAYTRALDSKGATS